MDTGSLIGAGVGLLGGIYGGIKAGQERKKMERYLTGQEQQNEAWYNANALSDYTQRGDTLALMRNLRENLKKQNRSATNTAVVTGATPEQQAIQKELSNEVISDTYSNIGAMGQRWKDSILDRYMQRKDNFSNQRVGMMNQSANSYENLMNNGFNMTGTSSVGLFK
jgi:hypothetical protein